MIQYFVNLILSFDVPKVVQFVTSSTQQMVHITQLYGNSWMSFQIMSYVDLTETSFSNKS